MDQYILTKYVNNEINKYLYGAFHSGPVLSGPTQQKTANSLMIPPKPRARRGLACDVIIRHYMS